MLAHNWYTAAAAQRFPNNLSIPSPDFTIRRTQVMVTRYREDTLHRYWKHVPASIPSVQVTNIKPEREYYDVRWRIRCEGLKENCIGPISRIKLMGCDSQAASFFVQRCYRKDEERALILITGYANDATRIGFDDLCWPCIMLDVPAASTQMVPMEELDFSQLPPAVLTHHLKRLPTHPYPMHTANTQLSAHYPQPQPHVIHIPPCSPLDLQKQERRQRRHNHSLRMRPAFMPPDMSRTPRVHRIEGPARRLSKDMTNQHHNCFNPPQQVRQPLDHKLSCPFPDKCILPGLCPFEKRGM